MEIPAITTLEGSGIALEKVPESSEAWKLLTVLPVRVSPLVPLPGGLVISENAKDPEPTVEVTPGPPRAPAMTIGDVAGAVKDILPLKVAEPLPGKPLSITGPVKVTVRRTAPPTGLVKLTVPEYWSCWIWPLTMVAGPLLLTRVKVSRAARDVAPVPIVVIVTALDVGPPRVEEVVRFKKPPEFVPVTKPWPNCEKDMIGAALAVLASITAARHANPAIRPLNLRIGCLLKVV